MTPELKPCPACGKLTPNFLDGDRAYCGGDGCGLMGPRNDTDGAKWNALPRNYDPPRDGARIRRARDYIRGLTIYPLTGPGYTIDAIKRDVALHCLDAAIAETELDATPSGDGARLRKLRELLGKRREFARCWVEQKAFMVLDDACNEIDKLLAEPEPPAAVQVPEDVRKWAEWINADPKAIISADGYLDVARWILSLPTAPLDAEVERLRAENKRLHEAAQLWFNADGTETVLPVGEVIERRKNAAKRLVTLQQELRKTDKANSRLGAESGRLRTALQVLVAEMARQGGGK